MRPETLAIAIAAGGAAILFIRIGLGYSKSGYLAVAAGVVVTLVVLAAIDV